MEQWYGTTMNGNLAESVVSEGEVICEYQQVDCIHRYLR